MCQQLAVELPASVGLHRPSIPALRDAKHSTNKLERGETERRHRAEPCCAARRRGPTLRPAALPSAHRALVLPAATMLALRRLQRAGQPLGWVRGFAAAAQPAPADDLITVTVDGKEVQVPKGSNVLAACDAAGVDIPRCLGRWRGYWAAGGDARVPIGARDARWALGSARQRVALPAPGRSRPPSIAPDPQVLLPPAAVHRGQLQDVLGGGAPAAAAAGGGGAGVASAGSRACCVCLNLQHPARGRLPGCALQQPLQQHPAHRRRACRCRRLPVNRRWRRAPSRWRPVPCPRPPA